MENSNDGFGFGGMGISGSTPGASQDDIVHLDDDNEGTPRAKVVGVFRQAHLNPMNKENIMNQGECVSPKGSRPKKASNTSPMQQEPVSEGVLRQS